MSAPVAFVDTETTGLDADVQPIWELAIIRPDGTEHVYQVKVTPRQIDLAHPKALEISGFTERYVPARAIEPARAAHLVSSLLEGCHLAGAVVSFDEERLRRMCWAHGQPVTWHYHLLDVEALAAGKVAMPPPLGLYGPVQGRRRRPGRLRAQAHRPRRCEMGQGRLRGGDG